MLHNVTFMYFIRRHPDYNVRESVSAGKGDLQTHLKLNSENEIDNILITHRFKSLFRTMDQ